MGAITSRRLALKLTVLLACLLSVLLLAFSFIVIRVWSQASVNAAISETERFADTIKRSAQYSMMHAQKEAMREIITVVGAQRDIEWVRLFNKEGRVIYSTHEREIGTVIDKRAEACYRCHRAEAPLERLSGRDRSRIFSPANDSHSVLATIAPIYNEPACSSAECHVHPASKQVLGVLDVAMSLTPTNQLIREQTVTIVTFGLAAVALIFLIVAFFVHRHVGGPVRRLVTGTQKIAGGDFSHRIPLSGNDELTALADSFNRMTESLGRAYAELRDLASTLEQRVEQKTRELQSAQQQVIRTEKLASLGRMAAGVAHELNNPLTGMLTFAHLLARKAPKDSQDYADLQLIIGETNRCSKIIKDLLQFARESPPQRRPENLNEVIRQTILILQPQAQFHDIRLRLQLETDLPRSVVDAAQIKQVLMNILLNAAEAMPKGGDLTIATVSGPPGKITIAVSDTGSGIAPEHLPSIFDPFFTTKDPGKGTGLGLSVSLKLIENHGGTIEVSSEVDRGSTFRILLPREGAGGGAG
jgi:two-component system NtrC family sensor kinase